MNASDPTVLVVEDELCVLHMLDLALRRYGLAVRLAASGEEAVAIYERQCDAIDVVLLDVRMPGGMDGPQTLAALRNLNPEVRCCFMSGDVGKYDKAELLAMGAIHIYDKPFRDLGEFVRILRQAAQGGGDG